MLIASGWSFRDTIAWHQDMSTALTSEGVLMSTEAKLSDLWTQAVQEYRNIARLSKQEEELLQHSDSAERFLELTKDGWDEAIVKRQSLHYESIQTAVCHVLGVFEVLSPALGLAGHVSSDPSCFLLHNAHSCRRHSRPLVSFLVLLKFSSRSAPYEILR